MSKSYAVVSAGVVINVVVWDGETEWSPETGAAIETDGSVGIGWLYHDGTFSPPPVEPPTHDDLVVAAEQEKQSRLAEANSAIANLQDAVDLDIATDDETAALLAWKKYRVLLMRVDTTAPDIEFPALPN